MSHYSYAWASITGKVFVSDDELAENLGVSLEGLPDVHPERIQVAFQDIANDKLNALFATDEPIKVSDIDIDMDTFHS